MSSADAHITEIEPIRGWVRLELRELWRYRELVYFLTWRDIKVRYKQTLLGAGWAVLQPVFAMIVFTVFFGRLAKMPSDGIPYPVFSLAALVPWTFFASGLANAAAVLVGGQNLITKVYFPRLVMPIASVLSGLIDFAVAMIVLAAMMLYFGVHPTPRMLWIVPLILLATCTALGLGAFLAALNVRFRDIRYVIPFMVQLWIFVTPVVYPSSLIPEPWRTVYGLNPMASVVDGFRWALLGSPPPPAGMLAVSIAAGAVMLAFGVVYFRRTEASFADFV